ncbi:MAG: hypothetical protein JRF72_04910 [Deltaproteobacteria bacterium]|jgi:hypothetical protein|nr:hypothetical protein [Deltaproteobacteria bacterium]
MGPKKFLAPVILVLIIALLFSACVATGNRGKLVRTNAPTEKELQANWNDYIVHRWGLKRATAKNTVAISYQLKNDTRIIFNRTWTAITSEEQMKNSIIMSNIWVRKILGQNDKLFGYLVHRSNDNANVRIIDENTIELFYHYVPTSPR